MTEPTLQDRLREAAAELDGAYLGSDWTASLLAEAAAQLDALAARVEKLKDRSENRGRLLTESEVEVAALTAELQSVRDALDERKPDDTPLPERIRGMAVLIREQSLQVEALTAERDELRSRFEQIPTAPPSEFPWSPLALYHELSGFCIEHDAKPSFEELTDKARDLQDYLWYRRLTEAERCAMHQAAQRWLRSSCWEP